jgi:hypothetical protein
VSQAKNRTAEFAEYCGVLSALLCVLCGLIVYTTTAVAEDVESRVLTHYIPQDLLETAVRTENWTELSLNVKGGLRKDDTIRIWAGGSIDHGNGDQPGENICGPEGLPPVANATQRHDAAPPNLKNLALSQEPNHAFALLFKSEGPNILKSPSPGKPLEIKLTKDKEKLWLGFNDERGRFHDNHLGKGRRHELDPLWVRIEVVRTIVD